MKVIAIATLLLCALAVFVSAGKHHNVGSSSTIELDVFSGSNSWWIAVAVNNADVDTKSVQIKDSKSSEWEQMSFNEGWGYWAAANPNAFEFPVSILLTSVDGETITLEDAITSDSLGATVETSEQYVSADVPIAAPTSRSNKHATTTTTKKHTTTTTTKAPKHTTTTTTKKGKATTTTTTKKATTTTTTTKKASTSGSSSGSSGGCSGGLKLMVPLYSYPGNDWNTVAASGSVVPTVAIINPNSGPGSGPDSSYTSYMNKLHSAGVEMVGYVHTSYGARSISDVKADIDVYATKFDNLVGIFLDEASASSSQVSYYAELYSYIMSMPGWKYDILNPGAVAAAGYNSAATTIVSFEDVASKFASSANPSGASCSNKDLYAVISYSASSASTMQSVVDAAVSKGYYGYVYATSGTLSGNTYGTLPSYYAQMASYIASKN